MVRKINIWFWAVLIVIGLSVAGHAAPAGTAADQSGPSTPGSAAQQADAGPTDIHDIRHPVQVGVNPAIYYGAAGGAALLIIGLLVWMLVRRRRQRSRGDVADVTATIFQSPEEEALEGLAALEKNRPEQPAIFYFRLSAIFRRYLQRRFDVDAPEMTTEELLPRLSGLDIDRATQSGLKTFLKFGDQVKFARALPDPADMMAHLTLIRDMVSKFAAAESTAGAGGQS